LAKQRNHDLKPFPQISRTQDFIIPDPLEINNRSIYRAGRQLE
jgi:hypothetical protein